MRAERPKTQLLSWSLGLSVKQDGREGGGDRQKLSRLPAAENFRKRATLCLEKEGGHFEHSFCKQNL